MDKDREEPCHVCGLKLSVRVYWMHIQDEETDDGVLRWPTYYCPQCGKKHWICGSCGAGVLERVTLLLKGDPCPVEGYRLKVCPKVKKAFDAIEGVSPVVAGIDFASLERRIFDRTVVVGADIYGRR